MYDLCDPEAVSCAVYCKARDALTKHFGFADFRPWKSFSRLGGLWVLTTAHFMALTASALPEIEATIISSLHLREPIVVTLSA